MGGGRGDDALSLEEEDTGVGLCTRLQLPIWYVECQNRGAGGNRSLRDIGCKFRLVGVAIKEGLNAKNRID